MQYQKAKMVLEELIVICQWFCLPQASYLNIYNRPGVFLTFTFIININIYKLAKSHNFSPQNFGYQIARNISSSKQVIVKSNYLSLDI